MPTIDNQDLYNAVKKYADTIYTKPSAFKSAFIVKTYKQRGGTYSKDNKPKNLRRWLNEKWVDITDGKGYPVLRPSVRISPKTPLTINQIDPSNLKKQIALKQVLKGDFNLPKFEGKGIEEYSNPKKVFRKAREYLGNNVDIRLSTNPQKKYMVFNPKTNKWVHFGQMGYEDFTKHLDLVRRSNYLTRSASIKGDWRKDKYSPNMLSRQLLWQ
jgi:hypothetical protein